MAAQLRSTSVRGFRGVQRATLGISRQQARRLSLHEYQSQKLLKDYGVPVPRGELAQSPEEVRAIVEELGGACIVKSQILKGGRGKGVFENGFKGGIQMVRSPEEGLRVAKQMLGHRLKTKQSLGDGLEVNKVYVAETVKYVDEWYLAMTIDREKYQPAIIISQAGGVDIETMAKEHPDQLLTFHFSLTKGITPELVEQISQALDRPAKKIQNLKTILTGMLEMFKSKDATLLEINPLVRDEEGNFTCLDAKCTFDNAAEKRQPELFALRDRQQEVGDEIEAEKYGLVYVRLDGNIGNVVNGAGLAMATNDAIAFHGGRSANFLDAGGQATKETMQKAFEIIIRDHRVEAILVNIYGGIIRCDMIAESIIGAAAELGPLRVPVVVRLQGTNAELGLKLIEESNLGLYTESEFGSAAKKVVELAGGGWKYCD